MASSTSHSSAPAVDAQYVQYSQKMWDKFAQYAFYAVIFAVAVLLLMAATLL